MSKTLGNVISIQEMLERFGADGTRYLLLASGNFTDDIDITMERLVEKYNADLANGVGNLVSRVMKLAESLETLPDIQKGVQSLSIATFFERYNISEALTAVWSQVRNANKYMDEQKPWILVKEDQEKFKTAMAELFHKIQEIARELEPFLPETSGKIKIALETGKTEPLFQRIV